MDLDLYAEGFVCRVCLILGHNNGRGNIIPPISLACLSLSPSVCGLQENGKMADDNVWTEKLHKMALDKEKAFLQPHQRPGEPCGYQNTPVSDINTQV